MSLLHLFRQFSIRIIIGLSLLHLFCQFSIRIILGLSLLHIFCQFSIRIILGLSLLHLFCQFIIRIILGLSLLHIFCQFSIRIILGLSLLHLFCQFSIRIGEPWIRPLRFYLLWVTYHEYCFDLIYAHRNIESLNWKQNNEYCWKVVKFSRFCLCNIISSPKINVLSTRSDYRTTNAFTLTCLQIELDLYKWTKTTVLLSLLHYSGAHFNADVQWNARHFHVMQ